MVKTKFVFVFHWEPSKLILESKQQFLASHKCSFQKSVNEIWMAIETHKIPSNSTEKGNPSQINISIKIISGPWICRRVLRYVRIFDA